MENFPFDPVRLREALKITEGMSKRGRAAKWSTAMRRGLVAQTGEMKYYNRSQLHELLRDLGVAESDAAKGVSQLFELVPNQTEVLVDINSRSLRSCEYKVRYGHKETAEKAVRVMEDKTGDFFDAYHCEHCDRWHIGHSKTI